MPIYGVKPEKFHYPFSVIAKSFCGNLALSTVLPLYAMFTGIMDSVVIEQSKVNWNWSA